MKTKGISMKIMYVNGFREDYELSSTYLKLKDAGLDIEPCQWKYGDDVRKKINECIKRIKPKIIIASSTAGLFVTDYDIPVILINPVVDRKDLEKLFPDKNFNTYPMKPSKKSPYIEVIIGKKDKLLDYKKTLEFFKDNEVTLITYEGHKLKDITPILRAIKTYQYFVKKELDFEFDPLILKFFTKEELNFLIDNAMALGDSKIILVKKDNEMFEITCNVNNIKIFDLNKGDLVSKKELFKRLNKSKNV